MKTADRRARFVGDTMFELPTTRATPPTLDDVFVELYMDKSITQRNRS